VDLAVVVEAHARAPATLDDEQERALLPRGSAGEPEERGPEGDDEPHQAREHLVHLREVHRLARREGGRQARGIPRAVHPAVRDDLEWKAAAGHPDALGEAGNGGAPRPFSRREDNGCPSESSASEIHQRALVGEPARERRHRGAPAAGPGRSRAG
jgi:hypothetical protein